MHKNSFPIAEIGHLYPHIPMPFGIGGAGIIASAATHARRHYSPISNTHRLSSVGGAGKSFYHHLDPMDLFGGRDKTYYSYPPFNFTHFSIFPSMEKIQSNARLLKLLEQ